MLISSSFLQYSYDSLPRGPRGGVQAPLAMPEKIEIADTYGTVFVSCSW